jgi:hypothetical protein
MCPIEHNLLSSPQKKMCNQIPESERKAMNRTVLIDMGAKSYFDPTPRQLLK